MVFLGSQKGKEDAKYFSIQQPKEGQTAAQKPNSKVKLQTIANKNSTVSCSNSKTGYNAAEPKQRNKATLPNSRQQTATNGKPKQNNKQQAKWSKASNVAMQAIKTLSSFSKKSANPSENCMKSKMALYFIER